MTILGAFLRVLLIHIVLQDKEIRNKKALRIIENHHETSILLTISAYTFVQN